MSDQMTPAIQVGSAFALVGGVSFTALAVYLSVRQRRMHPLLLLCISAMSFSWIEAPYDWAMYAQFPAALPRMPSWWPLNMTWGGLPLFVPIGYISYFVLPAFTATALGRWLIKRFGWRRPQTLLTVGLLVGFTWALLFNGFLGAKLGVFYYGRVIPGLAIREGTIHQYPLYDALAMAIQMMVFTYLLGRTDGDGRNVLEMWAAKRSKTPLQAATLSVVAVILVGNLLYGAVFAPHLITKLGGWVSVEPPGQLFPGIPNQPK
ncbi:spirocyclase AveC family protein [Mycobacterium paraterrae]|uniref:Spirocyclase AveC family protein n=1 Tax=Mycobacterium paraterrae TaxID=577492 RepID=A0ABY3VM42_9MYCO|nr:spirocyclase AveC family protein [Mycobacterium paraterrae]UMB70496.1 spirocyclase AveC family protein [Mycobacterium paraterrae]